MDYICLSTESKEKASNIIYGKAFDFRLFDGCIKFNICDAIFRLCKVHY